MAMSTIAATSMTVQSADLPAPGAGHQASLGQANFQAGWQSLLAVLGAEVPAKQAGSSESGAAEAVEVGANAKPDARTEGDRVVSTETVRTRYDKSSPHVQDGRQRASEPKRLQRNSGRNTEAMDQAQANPDLQTVVCAAPAAPVAGQPSPVHQEGSNLWFTTHRREGSDTTAAGDGSLGSRGPSQTDEKPGAVVGEGKRIAARSGPSAPTNAPAAKGSTVASSIATLVVDAENADGRPVPMPEPASDAAGASSARGDSRAWVKTTSGDHSIAPEIGSDSAISTAGAESSQSMGDQGVGEPSPPPASMHSGVPGASLQAEASTSVDRSHHPPAGRRGFSSSQGAASASDAAQSPHAHPAEQESAGLSNNQNAAEARGPEHLDRGHASTASHDPAPGGDSIAALDRESGTRPVTIHGNSRHAEAGFQDPALGWVGVRAELGGGSIHAAVVPDTVAAARVLSAHMSGLHTYLDQHRTTVETLTMAMPGDGGGQNTGQNRGQSQQGPAESTGETQRAAGEALTAPSRTESVATASDPSAPAEGHISLLA